MKIFKRFCMCTVVMIVGALSLILSGCAFSQEGHREMVHITYVANDIVEVDVERGTLCATLEVPSKVGYRFVGWYKDDTFTNEFPSAYPFMESVTLYAKFERLTYNVKFISGPGYRFLTENIHVANYGDSYTFSLEVFDGYDASNMKVVVGDKVLPCNEDKTYTIENIKSPLTVKVIDLRSLEHYKVYLPTTHKGYSIVELTNSDLTEGESYSFCVVLDPAYSNSKFIVKANDEVLNGEGNIYKVENVHEDIYIKIENVKINQYAVRFTGNDYDVDTADYTVVNDGDSFSFKLNFDEKYDISQIVVTANNQLIVQDEKGIYKVNNIKEDISIDVTGYFIKVVHVTVDHNDGYEVTFNQNTYYYGNSAVITIRIKEGYEAEHLIVKCDGKLLLNENNKYLVSYMTKDVHVSIEGVNRKEMVVHLVNGAGYTFAMNKSKVFYGDDVTFSVVASEGYDASHASIVINGRGYGSHVVSLTDVKEELVVEAIDVVKKIFTITSKACDGVTITLPSKEVYYGDTLHFTINIHPDYDASQAKLLINGKVVPFDTKTIENITENITIEVIDVVKKTFEIVVQDSVGATIAISHSKVTIHDAIHLTVTTFKPYDASKLVLHINEKVILLESLTYDIQDICDNLVIYLEDLPLKVFDVVVEECIGVKLSTIPSCVKYGESISFSITALDGYVIDHMIVMANGNTVSMIDGKYVISDITQNTKIVITNVVKERFCVTLANDTGYTITADNALFVEYGEDFIFNVAIEEGYRLIGVYVNDGLIVGENNTYLIKSIHENKTVRVLVEKLPEVDPTPNVPESTFEAFEITFFITGLSLDENNYTDYFTIEGDLLIINEDVLMIYDIEINDEQISGFGIYEITGLYEITIKFVEK